MPSSDLILNVRQISGYPTSGVQTTDAILIQRGLGGPYLQLSAEDLVATALVGSLAPLQVGLGAPVNAAASQVFASEYVTEIDGALLWNAFFDEGSSQPYLLTSGPAALVQFDAVQGWRFNSGPAGAAGTPVAMATQFTVSPSGYGTLAQQLLLGRDPASPLETATMRWVGANTVASWNGRTGAVILTLNDILGAGGAPLLSPQLYGTPRAPTPAPGSNNNNLATTAFVANAITALAYAPLDSPAFTGTPTVPTPAPGDNSAVIANTAFVTGAVNQLSTSISGSYAPLASPNFSGVPSAPTAAPGSSTAQLATTAFVMAAVSATVAGVSSFNTRTGAVILGSADLSAAGGALLSSPAFTGSPTAPTATAGTASGVLATTQFVQTAVAAVNAGVTTFNSRSGAVTLTTADITGAGGALAVDAGVTTFNGRSGAITLTANDVSAAGALVNPSPALSGVPTAPTAAPATNTTQLATTAFVAAAIAAVGAGVISFNGRSGAVSLTLADVTGVNGAPINSPSFSGVPLAPTATGGTNTNQIATCAFVAAAIGAGVAGVSSFNTLTGAVTLTSTDITNAGGALAAQAGVSSFNSRTGAITLTANDISAAGGAPLLSPALTGVPTAPTAAPGVTTTQLATCAFVMAAIGGPYLPLSGGTLTGVLTVPTGVRFMGTSASVIGFNMVGTPSTLTLYNGGTSLGAVPYYAGSDTPIYAWALVGTTSIVNAFYNNNGVPGGFNWPVTLSDRRLKSGIKAPKQDALALIAALKVHQFTLTPPFPEATPQHWPFGLIADEVEATLPIAYIPPPPHGHSSIRELPLVAALVGAVQQLMARLERLETRIAT